MTSIDRAAMAMMATMAIATSTIVTPRSRREGPVQRNLRIAGGFIIVYQFPEIPA
jgi:hypothetical protein